jgi:hypothetical protein
MLRQWTALVCLPIAAALTLVLSGCTDSTAPAPLPLEHAANATPNPAQTEGSEHAHKPGGHGGNIVAIGRDNYHAEAVFEKGGTLKLYMLGQDEARVQEVESQELTAYVKPEGAAESIALPLRAAPQPGDAPGQTSQFVGRIPAGLAGQSLEVTIPSLRIAGERFRVGFTSASPAHEEAMPAKVADEAERALYLTPGGKYTAADIAANGHLTASQKFKGAKAAHDLQPRLGDAICPITLTRANPKFTWIVGGKAYEFCCPPCVDEFVQTAKEHPEAIKEPTDYVKK